MIQQWQEKKTHQTHTHRQTQKKKVSESWNISCFFLGTTTILSFTIAAMATRKKILFSGTLAEEKTIWIGPTYRIRILFPLIDSIYWIQPVMALIGYIILVCLLLWYNRNSGLTLFSNVILCDSSLQKKIFFFDWVSFLFIIIIIIVSNERRTKFQILKHQPNKT